MNTKLTLIAILVFGIGIFTCFYEKQTVVPGRSESLGGASTYFAEVGVDGTVLRVIVADQSFIDSGVVGDPSNWVPTSFDLSDTSAEIGGKYVVGTGFVTKSEVSTGLPPPDLNSIVIEQSSTTEEI